MDDVTHQPTDLLEGVDEITAFLRALGIRATKRRTFRMCENRQIPAGKLGGGWIGSRSAIAGHLSKLSRGEAA
jgi:hypothetical protein